MTLCNNFPIIHLRIVTDVTSISIDVPGSESVLLPDNCYSVSGWAAVNICFTSEWEEVLHFIFQQRLHYDPP